MEDKNEYYCSILHEDWCDLLSTMEVKNNKKRAVAQINRLATSKVAPVNYDTYDSIMLPIKKKARTGALPSCKNHG